MENKNKSENQGESGGEEKEDEDYGDGYGSNMEVQFQTTNHSRNYEFENREISYTDCFASNNIISSYMNISEFSVSGVCSKNNRSSSSISVKTDCLYDYESSNLDKVTLINDVKEFKKVDVIKHKINQIKKSIMPDLQNNLMRRYAISQISSSSQTENIPEKNMNSSLYLNSNQASSLNLNAEEIKSIQTDNARGNSVPSCNANSFGFQNQKDLRGIVSDVAKFSFVALKIMRFDNQKLGIIFSKVTKLLVYVIFIFLFGAFNSRFFGAFFYYNFLNKLDSKNRFFAIIGV